MISPAHVSYSCRPRGPPHQCRHSFKGIRVLQALRVLQAEAKAEACSSRLYGCEGIRVLQALWVLQAKAKAKARSSRLYCRMIMKGRSLTPWAANGEW